MTAGFLRKIRRFYDPNSKGSSDVVISVPSYFGAVERQAVMDACRIANVNCVRIMNESTAIALGYGFFRKAELTNDKPRNVVFVDFGHSKVTCTIVQYTKDKGKILAHTSDRNFGTR